MIFIQNKKKVSFVLAISILIFLCDSSYAQTATYNIILNISSSKVITNSNQDDFSGLNPVYPESLTVIPGVGATNTSVSSVSRIRTNENSWNLQATSTGNNFGSSMITASNIFYTYSQMVGSQAAAGVFVAPYPGPITLAQLSANMSVIMGSQMTSTSRGSPIGSNTNNYVQITTITAVEQDYFFEEDLSPFVNTQYDLIAP